MQEYTIGSAGSKIQVADVDLSDRSNLDVSNALEGRLQQPRSVDDDLGPGDILVLQQPIQFANVISSTSTRHPTRRPARNEQEQTRPKTHGDRRDHTLRIIHRISRSSERNAPILLERLLSAGVRGGGIGHPAGEITGCDGVDPDAEVSTGKLGGELVREGDGRGPAELITSIKGWRPPGSGRGLTFRRCS
jgi:hypothetical protein